MWILIITIQSGTGNCITSMEFGTRDAARAAEKELTIAYKGMFRQWSIICVQKG